MTADAVEATEVNEDGSVKRTHKLASKYSMFLPAFRGADCFRNDNGKWIEGLTESARIHPDRPTSTQPELPQHLRRRGLRRDPAGRADCGPDRHAEDGLHDRIDGDSGGA